MRMKRWMSFLLCLLLCGALLAATATSAHADGGQCGDNLYWSFNSSTGTLTITGSGKMYDFEYYRQPWHSVKRQISSIIIEDGATSIGNYAFDFCMSLTSITIPNGVTSIGKWAFSECWSLTSITIPASVTFIDYGAFDRCTSLTSITIPNSVTSIGPYSFEYCTGLTSITIPNSVTSIGGGAFSRCERLTSIQVAQGNQNYTSVDGVLFSKNITELLQYPPGKKGSYSIPDSVTSIGGGAFFTCTGLTSITIPNSVTSIGGGAFSHCTGLTSITIPNGVTGIAVQAFSHCTGLTSITIPNGVTSIGNEAFLDCERLTSITIPNNVTSIGDSVFSGCKRLTSVTIPNGVTSIGDMAFYDCKGLTSITIPNSVTSFGRGAFANCEGLTSIAIPNSVTSIECETFAGCTGLTSIIIPNSVTSIGDFAFYECKRLTSVTIPNSVTSIGGQAFSTCEGLTSITIPASVTFIDYGAFEYCFALKDVYYLGTKAQKEQIDIDSGNDPLLNATWHYGETAPDPITPPTIKTQPKSVKVKSGEQATFTVKATGEGVTYQWYSRPNANAKWTAVKDATSDTYTVVGTKNNNGWQFRCRAKNKGGEVYSEAATLTVSIAPTITTQPKSANVKSGSKAKFTVKVKEKGVTYQWFSKAPGAADWTPMAGETKATLTVVGTKANSGTQYRCRVRTAAGGEANTNPATLTVKIQPPVIKTQPKSLTAKSGKKVKFSVKASGPKLTYTWYSRPNAESEWTAIAGQAKNSLSIVASKANDGSQYYCHIQNADGEVDSAVVTLTVTPQPPSIKTQPKDAKVKLGAKAKFKVKATGKNVTYQWYYRTSETGDWVPMEGETSATLTVTATAEKIGWQFRCRVWNGDGEAYSNPATLRQK